MNAALFQALAAAVVAGVSVAWIGYAVGADRVIVAVVRHPLRSFEIVVAALILANLPAPKVKHRPRHIAVS